MHVHEGAGGGWKMALELKLQVVVSWPMWVLQTKLQSSVRAASDLSYWTIVPGLICASLGYEYLTESSNMGHSIRKLISFDSSDKNAKFRENMEDSLLIIVFLA